MDATLLPIGSVNAGTVKIQPVVLLQICDAYIRRNEKQERVIGTLLGNTSADGVVEVKSCYVVPHNESADQVSRGIVGLMPPGIGRPGVLCACARERHTEARERESAARPPSVFLAAAAAKSGALLVPSQRPSAARSYVSSGQSLWRPLTAQ